jgi:hypothetical protein
LQTLASWRHWLTKGFKDHIQIGIKAKGLGCNSQPSNYQAELASYTFLTIIVTIKPPASNAPTDMKIVTGQFIVSWATFKVVVAVNVCGKTTVIVADCVSVTVADWVVVLISVPVDVTDCVSVSVVGFNKVTVPSGTVEILVCVLTTVSVSVLVVVRLVVAVVVSVSTAVVIEVVVDISVVVDTSVVVEVEVEVVVAVTVVTDDAGL